MWHIEVCLGWLLPLWPPPMKPPRSHWHRVFFVLSAVQVNHDLIDRTLLQRVLADERLGNGTVNGSDSLKVPLPR